MPTSLLLDFGATRIKAALCDTNNGNLFEIKSRLSTPSVQNGVVFEIPFKALLKDFLSVCEEYAKQYDFTDIFICCQMHGFVLTDETDQPLTEYISWQDDSASVAPLGAPSSWDLFKEEFSDSFKEITGLRLRAGFPVVKIWDFLRKNHYEKVKVLSLGEALCLAGKSFHQAHITMSAGSGCLDFNTKHPSKKILDFIKLHTGTHLEFNEVAQELKPAGEIVLHGKKVCIWTAVGDHQCAVLGAGNNLDSLSVNLGTGSQVSAVCTVAPDIVQAERRHFFGGQELLTITHIPAGRVLAALMSFYTQLTGRDGWRKFNDVSVDELQNSKLPVFNLALFTDAWGYENGGAITSLTLENLSENALWAGLFRSFAMQYVRALDNLKIPGRKEIILSGGKLSQSNVLLHYLNKKTGIPVRLANMGDETLVGLAELAKKYC